MIAVEDLQRELESLEERVDALRGHL